MARARPKRREGKPKIGQAAIDAWRAGDTWGLHDALDLAPFQMTPFPPGTGDGFYCLPDHETGLDWQELKALQAELFEVAGTPGTRK